MIDFFGSGGQKVMLLYVLLGEDADRSKGSYQFGARCLFQSGSRVPARLLRVPA